MNNLDSLRHQAALEERSETAQWRPGFFQNLTGRLLDMFYAASRLRRTHAHPAYDSDYRLLLRHQNLCAEVASDAITHAGLQEGFGHIGWQQRISDITAMNMGNYTLPMRRMNVLPQKDMMLDLVQDPYFCKNLEPRDRNLHDRLMHWVEYGRHHPVFADMPQSEKTAIVIHSLYQSQEAPTLPWRFAYAVAPRFIATQELKYLEREKQQAGTDLHDELLGRQANAAPASRACRWVTW
jgi:hypothetical protein